MATVEELRRSELRPVQGGTFQGLVAAGATDMGQRIYVTVQALGDAVIGPCRWQARDATSHPARGDSCLVTFDDRGEPWVTAWWPFST